ncbi:hypothetical protein [Paenibacillus hexagrammi]|uniref:Uncharacterized protein n=1 Tax=Paenibacillus hexagrammi TaxID=2908839 RepID=A0ABY3SQ24_9BACL|nr:hypothetical protein [Paenibacillus sp. YPD9-1]UJF35645.1 hypothetical protein L0M14_11470 [Paenibacillus sp. YPD9-1]
MERQVVQQKRKGIFWIAVSFLICPCHLPFTLTLGLSLLGGSAMGVMLREHLILAGVVVTLVWGEEPGTDSASFVQLPVASLLRSHPAC